MNEGIYFPVQLDLLRAGESGLEALETMRAFGVVNAGRCLQGANPERFQELAEREELPSLPASFQVTGADQIKWRKDQSRDAWLHAVVGCRLLGISGGSRESDAAVWAKHFRHGAPFFRVSRDWLWQAVYSARAEAGKEVEDHWLERRISWREFRVLAALLSACRNKWDFSFLGWEEIRARASGFHNKTEVLAWKPGPDHHCERLTRSQIRTTLERLEGLNFFAHVRYAKGRRGGLSAYSFRHKRLELVEAVKKWAHEKASVRAKVAANRGEELRLFEVANPSPSRSPTGSPTGSPT